MTQRKTDVSVQGSGKWMKDTANQRGRGQVIREQVFESREEGKNVPVIHLRVRTKEKKTSPASEKRLSGLPNERCGTKVRC